MVTASILVAACEAGDVEGVAACLRAGVDVNALGGEGEGVTALMAATMVEDQEASARVVRLLLDQASLEPCRTMQHPLAPTMARFTALHTAVLADNALAVRLLAPACGGVVNLVDGEGKSLLMDAMLGSAEEVVEALLGVRGVEVGARVVEVARWRDEVEGTTLVPLLARRAVEGEGVSAEEMEQVPERVRRARRGLEEEVAASRKMGGGGMGQEEAWVVERWQAVAYRERRILGEVE